LDRQPDELSAGHRQRVAVARATVRTPRVFLFDEPSSSLDAHIGASTRLEIRRLLRRLQATAIYVTHDVREAFSLAQRVAVMSPRRIEQVSTPTGLWSRPRNLFVADFVHQGVLNTFPAHMVEEEIALPVARVPAPSSLRARLRGRDRFVLGVRPSQVRLRPPGQGHMNGCVEVVEPLVLEGKQRVHVRGEQFTCVAECGVDLVVTRGDQVGLDLEIEGALLFEHESGQAIY
jgi:ABC-type sugar transport system ATPase subunit